MYMDTCCSCVGHKLYPLEYWEVSGKKGGEASFVYLHGESQGRLLNDKSKSQKCMYGVPCASFNRFASVSTNIQESPQGTQNCAVALGGRRTIGVREG